MIVLPTMRGIIGGFSPLVFSPALWLSDTGSTAGVWPDISGNSRDATGANPPSIQQNVLNGRQVRRFDGANDVLTSSLNINGYTGFTYVAVWKRTGSFIGFNCGYATTTPLKGLIGFSSTASGASLDGRPSGGSYFGTVAGVSSTSFVVAAGAYDLSNLVSYRNGVAGSSSAISTTSIMANASTSVGTLAGSSTDWCQGDIAEILVFPRALTTIERQAIESYLNSKYAIY